MIARDPTAEKSAALTAADRHAFAALELRDPLLRDWVFEAWGYEAAVDWIYGRGMTAAAWSPHEPIALTEVRHVHRLVFGRVRWDVAHSRRCGCGEPDRPGSFRQRHIEPFRSGVQPPPWPEVPPLMGRWLVDAQQLQDAGPAGFADALARLHADFLEIHPFIYGNGRAGRLLLNLLLVRLGCPPAIIHERERRKYMSALVRAQQGERCALAALLMAAMVRSSALAGEQRRTS